MISKEAVVTGRLRVAAYIRVSTDLADQENSYETQERYFNRMLSQNRDWLAVGIYADYGISGTSGQKRSGFQRILRHCREGRIDRIVTKSISRFARNTADFMDALNALHEAGATILFEKESMDTADAVSDFILTTLAAIAQEESRTLSENLNWGNQKRFLQGDVRNQDIYGYRFTDDYITTKSGYRYRAVEIVEEEARIVRWIFQRFVEGKSMRGIARELNQCQIPHRLSPYARKRMAGPARGQLRSGLDEGWTTEQIGCILRNERYSGEVLVQKTYTEDYLTHKVRVNKGEMTQYLVSGHHPAIISRELFDEAVKVREVNRARQGGREKRTVHAFSGRLICGCCGRYYCIRNTKAHPIWYCPSAERNNGINICRSERVYEEQIVRMFRKAMAQRYQLTVRPLTGNVKVADIMNGDVQAADFWPGEEPGFVGRLLGRLENMQRMDYVERDRAFLKRRIQTASQEESRKLAKRLEYLEAYWEELEADHEWRKRAILWMRSLPRGEEGTAEFLNGVTDGYVKAFALSVTIKDPLHYTVHWFDDTRTEVEMDTDYSPSVRKKGNTYE